MNKEKKVILTWVIIVSFGFLFILFPTLIFFNQKSWNINGKKIFNQNKNSEFLPKKIEQIIVEPDDQNGKNTIINNDKKNPIIEQIRNDAKKIPQEMFEVYKNVDECGKISNAQEKDFCIMLWAEHAKDKSLCEKTLISVKQECIDRATVAKAVSDKNLAICTEISNESYKKTCIHKIITEQNLSELDCRVLSADDEKDCRLFAAVSGIKNAEECNLLGDEWIRNSCKESFYVNLGQ